MGSIRVRTTVAAVLVVGVAMVLAALAMVSVLEGSLRGHFRTNATLKADALADGLDSGIELQELPLGDESEDEEWVQILDGSEVVHSSPNIDGRPVVVLLAPGEVLTVPPRAPADVEPFDDAFLVVESRTSGQAPPLTVIVGRSLEPVGEAAGTLTAALVVVVPLLLIVVGAVTWRVAARALSPVDAISAEVESISSRDLHRRVPDPPGDDEISRLAATMNRMLARLESGRLREREFVSDASHELRSPVAAIRQYAEVALAHPEQTEIGELAEVVLEEDARLQRLVEDLLLLTRLDEGTVRHPIEPVDLDDLLLEEAARLRASTDLRIDAGAVSAGRVVGDREQLARLIRNLTENAARHARGTIRLSLHERDGSAVLGVSDDGAGIESGQRRHIFRRFVRLDAARDRDSGGSGLGLAIVQEVATFHGGGVRIVESDLGGAGFEVRLPVHLD
ncbi:MAG: HAMP domain-containing sensor histidine kinase [Actinomycetota bacterium]